MNAPWSGHLRRNADGQFTGLLTDGVGLPIRLTATITDDASGRFFLLDGTRSKKPITDAPWPTDTDRHICPSPVDQHDARPTTTNAATAATKRDNTQRNRGSTR